MKRKISTIAAVIIALVASVYSANANVKPYKDLNNKEVLFSYVSASIQGSDMYNKIMFADDFEYRNTANDDKHDKKSYLKYLKSLKDNKFDCEQTIEILDQTGNTTIGKVTMEFPTFKRVDYVTLVQSEEGWKIKNVTTTYPL